MRGLKWGEERPSEPRKGRWTQVEIALLRDLYGLRDIKAIARELNRSEASIERKAEALFQKARRNGPWTSQEVEDLKKYLGLNAPEVIARILGRTPQEVQRQIFSLGRIQREGPWGRDEIQQFRRLYGTRTDEDLSVIFGRSARTVRELAKRLQLAKDKAFVVRERGRGATRMPRWGKAELDLLRELYPSRPNLEIAKRLSRSVKSVVSKANHLGLHKDLERLRQMGRENVRQRYVEPTPAVLESTHAEFARIDRQVTSQVTSSARARTRREQQPN